VKGKSALMERVCFKALRKGRRDSGEEINLIDNPHMGRFL